MNPLRFLVRAFIDVFGITHPTPEQEHRATLFISTMLGILLVLFTITVYAVFHGFRH